MALVDKDKGAVKLSEILVNEDLKSANTDAADTAELATTNLAELASWSNLITNRVLNSSGSISWDDSTNQIFIPDGVRLDLFIPIVPFNDSVIPIPDNGFFRFYYTAQGNEELGTGAIPTPAGAVFKLNAGDTLFIEANFFTMHTAPDSELSVSVPDSTCNFIIADLDSTPTIDLANGKLFIPIVSCDKDDATMINWLPSNIVWKGTFTQRLGIPVRGATLPLGSIIAWHRPDGVTSFVDQSVVDVYADGFWLCDGSIIVDAESPFNSLVSPNLTEKYLTGSDNTYPALNPSAEVGENAVSLVEAQLGVHRHSVPSMYDRDTSSSSLKDLGYTERDYRSASRYTIYNWPNNGGSDIDDGGNQQVNSRGNDPQIFHTHGGNYNTSLSGSSTGDHENKPRSMPVVFIMRIR